MRDYSVYTYSLALAPAVFPIIVNRGSPTLPIARISLRKPSEAVSEPHRVRLGGHTTKTAAEGKVSGERLRQHVENVIFQTVGERRLQ
jgi:hypothetical protein